MPLISLWQSNPAAVKQLSIEQIVATAGDGKLKDESQCSAELLEYLTQVDTDQLGKYAEHCLTNAFNNSGFVLQDIVNELGRRLDYTVTNGRYQGTVNSIGFDGIWKSVDGNSIVVEVKTTDTYRISLDTIAKYSSKLQENSIVDLSSVLIVVGRKDTGELEAQVRGSRHAWDMRLISIDSLLSLVRIKESADSFETSKKIRSLLIPMEYTRLDALVDVMFTTAKDVESAADNEKFLTEEGVATEKSTFNVTPSDIIVSKKNDVVEALYNKTGKKIIKYSRALYWDSEHKLRVACTVSKKYEAKGAPYWYAYHPDWDDFLEDGDTSYLALACIDLKQAFLIPLEIIRNHLDYLNKTTSEKGKVYWHIKILKSAAGKYSMLIPKQESNLPLDNYILDL